MTPTREPGRFVAFTDAVVAIALTLLILPLVDVVGEAARDGRGAPEVFTDNWQQIFSFLLSFVVIARLWFAHHELWQYVRALSMPLMRWNMLWILAVVILPFPTEMTSLFADERLTVAFYTGTILVASVCSTAMALIISRDPEVRGSDDSFPLARLSGAISSTSLFVVVFLLATLLGVGYWAFLVLFLAPVADRLWARRLGG